MTNIAYVLITPARDEERYIEKTIKSVVSQTVLPKKWVIVSDGSTDRTDEIVRQYAAKYPWIELIRMPEHNDRQFGAKVDAFNAGYRKIKDVEYLIVGNLDADISFDNDYFEFLLNRFGEIPKLGVAGTPFVEDGFRYNYHFANIEHVSGACQLFRRECFEEIGGFTPVEAGGEDWIAVTTARMKGWKTRTFLDKVCYHHRRIGTGSGASYISWFKLGRRNYLVGGHPLWQVFRSIYQMKNRPYILGGVLLFLGYVWASVCRLKRSVSDELMKFHRMEQMKRLKQILRLK